ncbi:hypothetical protein K7X08_014568 [Anisodus acutangulus]|uniref:Uncharacterized protein n=1 Tax=Anisodus acutangulus TaxID=402998 RepID=A0A9Q1R2H9_9SOLA|nr:hypothetical protein K7X08_014568 [Anisodus acutangulus]
MEEQSNINKARENVTFKVEEIKVVKGKKKKKKYKKMPQKKSKVIYKPFTREKRNKATSAHVHREQSLEVEENNKEKKDHQGENLGTQRKKKRKMENKTKENDSDLYIDEISSIMMTRSYRQKFHKRQITEKIRWQMKKESLRRTVHRTEPLVPLTMLLKTLMSPQNKNSGEQTEGQSNREESSEHSTNRKGEDQDSDYIQPEQGEKFETDEPSNCNRGRNKSRKNDKRKTSKNHPSLKRKQKDGNTPIKI